jgi:predicted membrane protein
MIKVSILKKVFTILIIFLVIYAGVLPLVSGQNLNSEIISTSIIVILIGIAYPLILYRPQWNKSVLFIEGLVVCITGSIFLTNPYNFYFIAIGAIIILISVLAYMKKLPNFLLGFFYR